MNRNVNIIIDLNGKKMVVIHDIIVEKKKRATRSSHKTVLGKNPFLAFTIWYQE